MRFTILAATLLMATLAQAETITCVFNTPRIVSTYNTEREQLSIYTVVYPSLVVKSAKLSTDAQGNQVVVNEKNETLLTLVADGQGNDGATDTMYPMTGVIDLTDVGTLPAQYGNKNYGGCEVQK